MAVKSDVLRKAKEAKNDEFYTQLDDIVKEIAQHKDYVRHFQGKTVLCNCDDPEWSSFVEFFRKFFKKLGLKKMICPHYEKDGSPSYKLEWSGEKINGDINDEVIKIIHAAYRSPTFFKAFYDEAVESLDTGEIKKKLVDLRQPRNQYVGRKDKLAAEIDNLDVLDPNYDMMYEDMSKRLRKLYDEISEIYSRPQF